MAKIISIILILLSYSGYAQDEVKSINKNSVSTNNRKGAIQIVKKAIPLSEYKTSTHKKVVITGKEKPTSRKIVKLSPVAVTPVGQNAKSIEPKRIVTTGNSSQPPSRKIIIVAPVKAVKLEEQKDK